MSKTIFLLSSSGPLRKHPVENPLWQTIELYIDDSFRVGGSVELALCEKVYDPKEQNLILDTIHMEGVLGMFRIVLAPRRPPDDRRLALREWWEPGDAPFRGSKRFGDDEWDLRTICTDVSVAKDLFREFFEHNGSSEVLLKNTHSIWDRASWIKPERK